jgi:signal peptidase I
VAALVVALLLRSMVAEPFAVPGGSMAPTLLEGDVVMVSRLAYGLKVPLVGLTLLPLAAPGRGDVVVFPDPRDRSRRMVRRVIGVAGDVIELREQQLFIGGVPQPRQALGERVYAEREVQTRALRMDTCRLYREVLASGSLASGHELLQCRRLRAGRNEGPFGPVPRGHLFMLGDNRDRSSDGRDGGWFVPVEEVIGRVALVGWGWGPGGWWFGRGTVQGVRIDRLLKPVE